MLISYSVGQASSQPSVVDQKPKLANTIICEPLWILTKFSLEIFMSPLRKMDDSLLPQKDQ